MTENIAAQYPAFVGSDSDVIDFPLGSLFLGDSGVAYRLVGWGRDWHDEDLPMNVPDFAPFTMTGGASMISSRNEAPYPLAVVFVPEYTEDEK